MIRAYDLGADGSVSRMRVFHNFYPGRSADGLCIDSQGNLHAAAGLHRRRGTSETLDTKPGVHVFSPQGKLLRFYPVPEDTITNCAFGGPDMKTLYVTAGKTLWKFQSEVAVHPGMAALHGRQRRWHTSVPGGVARGNRAWTRRFSLGRQCGLCGGT